MELQKQGTERYQSPHSIYEDMGGEPRKDKLLYAATRSRYLYLAQAGDSFLSSPILTLLQVPNECVHVVVLDTQIAVADPPAP
jgi:hypothetical protein